MDANQLNRCGKMKRKTNSNNQELQNGYLSMTSLQTYNFVVQSKVNCGVRRLRTSTKIGWLLQNF